MKLSDIIIIAWQKGQLSEGKAARLIGVDRLTLRTMRDELFKKEEHMQKVVVIVNGGDRVIPRPVLEKLIEAAGADTWECIDLPTESRRTKRAADLAVRPCPDCGETKPGIHSIHCPRFYSPNR